MGGSSLLPPCLLPVWWEKYFFVPLPTLKSVPTHQPQRPRVEGNVKLKPIFNYGKK